MAESQKTMPREEHEQKLVSYQHALASVAVLEVEAVGQARSVDPDAADGELMAKTAVMIDAMETTVAALFGETREQVREDMGQLDPQIVQNAMRKLAMLHAEQGRPMS